MKKCLLIIVAVLGLVILMNSGVMAATNSTQKNISVTLGPGSLTIEALSGNLTFTDLAVGTVIQHGFPYAWPAATAPSFTLTDATGSGDGWHVIFNCQKLYKEGDGTKYLQIAFNQSQEIIGLNDGMACDGAPTWNGPAKTIQDVANMNTDITVVKTSELYGMGQYTFETIPDNYYITLTPGNTYAGKYTGTFIATILTGPGGSGSWTGTVE